MNSKTTIALVIVVAMVLAGGIYVVATQMGGGNSEPKVYTANLLIETEDGFVEFEGTGTTVRELISDAVKDTEYELEILSNGNVKTVGGSSADEDKIWALFQWNAYSKWNVISVGNTADRSMADGTTYCISMSVPTTADGKTTYSVPDEEPTSVCWFFIKFIDDYNVDSVIGVYTEAERREGFWISGTGSDVAEAFADACEKEGFQLNLVYNGELRGWFGSFLGLEDEQLGSSLWKYWSQYHWDGDSWEFNDYTIGYYDPGVYGYFAFIRQITVEEGVDTDITITPEDCPGWAS